jgi:hypothetical protein
MINKSLKYLEKNIVNAKENEKAEIYWTFAYA